MRGQWKSLSPSRRLVTDVMRFAAAVPSVPVERTVDLSALIAARATWRVRPAWAAIFAKAYGQTAQEFPELRRIYLKWPWPHLYEYPNSVAVITVERIHQGEPWVLMRLIKDPQARRVADIAEIVRHSVEAPLDEVKDFGRMLTLGRLPGLVRRPLVWTGYNVGRLRPNYFGTFVVTAVSFMGADALHLPVWTTTLLTFGVFGPDGRVPLRITMDHRIFDGVAIAKILARLEAILQGPILEELRVEGQRSTSGSDRPGTP
jgi:hypothetical protein